MTTEQLLHLFGLGLLLLFSAFFSGSETALFALDRMRLNYLVQKKRHHAPNLKSFSVSRGVTFVVRKIGGRRIEEIEMILPAGEEPAGLS